jgi:hypothetical protein
MIGHTITFAHRGPETVMNVFPSVDDDIINCIDVQFIGQHGMPEDLAIFLCHVPADRILFCSI